MSMCYLLRVWKSLTVIFCPERPPFRLEDIRHWHGFNIREAIKAIYTRKNRKRVTWDANFPYKRHISSKIRLGSAKTRLILEQPLTLVLRYLHKTWTQSTQALIFGGKIIACRVDWQATGGKKLFTNYNAFSFPCPFCFNFSSLKYNEHAVIKGKKKPGLVHRGGKRFFAIL